MTPVGFTYVIQHSDTMCGGNAVSKLSKFPLLLISAFTIYIPLPNSMKHKWCNNENEIMDQLYGHPVNEERFFSSPFFEIANTRCGDTKIIITWPNSDHFSLN